MIRANLYTSGSTDNSCDIEIIRQWQSLGEGLIWIDIEGDIDDKELQLMQDFGCHELSIKDCKRHRHPPKMEVFSDNTFLLFRGIKSLGLDLSLEPQQIGFFVSDRYLITVHNNLSVSINEFWNNRMLSATDITPSVLATRLMHYSAGRYLEVILEFEDRLNTMEETLLGAEPEAAMKELVGYRSRLLQMRRVFGYHEKLSLALLEHHSDCQDNTDLKHISRDFYDRCERLFSLCSMYYETCGDLIDGYISISSHQLNHTMRVLTVITAIFIPLGFMAGLYGMNFDHMPELHFKYGYFALLGVMFITASTLIIAFRKKKWL